MSINKQYPHHISLADGAGFSTVRSVVTELAHIRLFVREGCHLCDVAQADLVEVLQRLPIPSVVSPTLKGSQAVQPLQLGTIKSNQTANPLQLGTVESNHLGTSNHHGNTDQIQRGASNHTQPSISNADQFQLNNANHMQASTGDHEQGSNSNVMQANTSNAEQASANTPSPKSAFKLPTEYWNVHYINVDAAHHVMHGIDPQARIQPSADLVDTAREQIKVEGLPADFYTFTVRVPVLEVRGETCLDLQFNQMAIQKAIALHWELR